MKVEKTVDYGNVKKKKVPTVYVIQEIPGTREGRPKINIMGAENMEFLNFYYQNFHKSYFLQGL